MAKMSGQAFLEIQLAIGGRVLPKGKAKSCCSDPPSP